MQALNASEINYSSHWAPFQVKGLKPENVRPLESGAGVEDRLRLVAFAELQARDLFRMGAERFRGSAPSEWIETWLRFAEVEERHAQMLLTRMASLGHKPGARSVSCKLWHLCLRAETSEDFLFRLSSAEERGMEAGFILGRDMASIDAESALIFRQIAEEEVEHVEMATRALAPFSIDQMRAKAREINSLVEAEILATGLRMG